ncbi:hypothetical protein B0H14DRAFT_2859867 [Mycena olivaceomarginata]|nr:hypothetical protein B0H14DRAFT_2859867 [Mycena olivaceomarginata]
MASRSCDENEVHARCSTFHRPTERGKEGILRTAYMSLPASKSTIVPQPLCRVGYRPASTPTRDGGRRAPPSPSSSAASPRSVAMNACSPFSRHTSSPAGGKLRIARTHDGGELQQLTRPMMPLRHPWYLCPVSANTCPTQAAHRTPKSSASMAPPSPRARPTSLPASPRRTGLALVPAPHSTYIAGGIRMYALVRTRR